jgi:zinc protease
VPPPISTPIPVPDPEAWRNTKPGPGPAAPIDFPEVQTAKLANGLSIYVVHKPAGVVSLSIVSRGGASDLAAGQSGLAALTVRMMTEGTKQKSALKLAETAEAIGTGLEESAGRDFVRLGITTLPDDMKSGLALLSEVVREPAFSVKELERVRKEWLDGIEAERQNPSRLASLVGLRALLGPAVGAPVNGSHDDVEKLQQPDLVRFYKGAFVPEKLALVVAGDVSLDQVKSLANGFFGGLRGAAPKAVHAELPPDTGNGKRILLVDRPGSVQTALFIGQRFPTRMEPGYEARELMNDVVGGLFTSRLNANLREKNAFTYGVHSVDIATLNFGAFAVMTGVRTDVTDAALREAFSELDKARDAKLGKPFTTEELATGRADLKQSLGASLADVSEVSARAETLFIYGLAPDYYRKYPALLDNADTVAVNAESQRLARDRMTIVVVGDRSVIEPKLHAASFEIVAAAPALSN